MKSSILQATFGNKRVGAALLGAALVLAAFGARADTPTYYWDINGSDPGAADDGNPPTAYWGSMSQTETWTLDPSGSSDTFGYSNRANIIFAATGDPYWWDTPGYTVLPMGTAQVSDIVIQDGNCTVSNTVGYLDKDTPYISVLNSGQVGAIDSVIASAPGTSNGITKFAPGILVLGATNTYRGPTTIEGGTLQLGAPQVLPTTSLLVLAGGDTRTNGYINSYCNNGTGNDFGYSSGPSKFVADGYSQTLGPLLLTGPYSNLLHIIDFGQSGASALAFADSHTQNWGGITLNLYNYQPGVNSLRFGTNRSGLTATQLGLLNFYNNLSVPGQIDANGFVTPAFPALTAAPSGSNNVRLTWNAISGRAYNIQCKTNLTDADWNTSLVTDVTATTNTASFTDTTIGTNRHRYYRIQLRPPGYGN